MRKHNQNNERIKRKYLVFLKQAKGQNEASIDVVAKALSRFEEYTRYKDFKAFHFEQAIGFKKYLARQKHYKTNKPLSLVTISGATRHLKAFVQWLSQQTGYKSRINYSDAEYFNISEKETRTAKARHTKPVATIDQVKHVLNTMPSGTSIEFRNRALIAFILLTGARDRAVVSMKLKHLDVNAGSVYQDAREVDTKFSKTFTTYFFPVGDEVLKILLDWVSFLIDECGFCADDPIFPKTKMKQGKDFNFSVSGLSKEHWNNASPVRKIFKDAFAKADLPYFNPHSFRNTLASLGEKLCQTPEEFKAWSQNLGHEKVLTTFYNYGEVHDGRQKEIFTQLKEPRATAVSDDQREFAKALLDEYRAQEIG